MTIVDLTTVDDVATITLTDGDAGNLLSADDLDLLEDSIKHVQHADTPLLVLRQQGRDFCGGRAPSPMTVAQREVLSSIVRRLRELNAVTVSVARGACTGFGVGLFAQADISIAGSSAWFQFPEVAKGHAPALVASWLFDYVPRKRALEWIMTGRRFEAHEAVEAGLATAVVPDEQIDAHLKGLVDELTSLDHNALRECRTLAEIMGGGPLDRRSQESIAVKWLSAPRAH